MWTIIISLIIGIIIGIMRFIPEKFMKFNSRFQQIGVVLLLFSMGASIGSNKELLKNLQIMGLKAASFAVLTTLFSIVVTYFVTKSFIGGVDSK